MAKLHLRSESTRRNVLKGIAATTACAALPTAALAVTPKYNFDPGPFFERLAAHGEEFFVNVDPDNGKMSVWFSALYDRSPEWQAEYDELHAGFALDPDAGKKLKAFVLEHGEVPGCRVGWKMIRA